MQKKRKKGKKKLKSNGFLSILYNRGQVIKLTPTTLTKGIEMVQTIKQANENIGGLSNAGKMPALSWNIPVEYCDTGSILIDVDGSACFGCYADAGRYKFSNVQNAL